MSTSSSQLSADIAQLHTDSGVMHSIVHGSENSSVQTEGGPVLTVAAAVKSIKTFTMRGAWATGTPYAFKDLYVDTSTNLVYMVVAAHTSTTISADLASGFVAVYQDGAFMQDGAGAALRTPQDKSREFRTPQDYMTDAQRMNVYLRFGTLDVSDALNKAYSALQDGGSMRVPAGAYGYATPLNFSGQKRFSFIGDGSHQTYLTYIGASSSSDCIVFGNDSSQTVGLQIRGINFQSSVLQTGGALCHFKNIVRASFRDVAWGDQDSNTNAYHGAWFDKVDYVIVEGYQCRAQKDGMRINGDVSSSGPKADVFLTNGKISACTVGLHIGGAMGGVTLDGANDIIGNVTNVLIDQGIAAQANREIFFGPACLLDSGQTSAGLNGVCLDVQDTDGFIFVHGSWIASAGTLVRIGANFAGRFYANSPLLYNSVTVAGGNGNAIEVANNNAYIRIQNPKFRNIQGAAAICTNVNPAVNFLIDDAVFEDNVAQRFINISPNSAFSETQGGKIINGKLWLGYDQAYSVPTDASPRLLATVGPSGGGSLAWAYFGNNASCGWLDFSKSRATTQASHAVVQNADMLGGLNFSGSDGTAFRSAAAIRTVVGGTAAAGSVPGRMFFNTAPVGGSLIDRWFLLETGNWAPVSDNAVSLGQSGLRVTSVWAANGTIQTSDVRYKTDIKDASLGLDFIKALRPISYKWVDGAQRIVRQAYRNLAGDEVEPEWIGCRMPDGTYVELAEGEPLPAGAEFEQPRAAEVITETIPGKRTHWGFPAQHVKETADRFGVDFGGWILSDPNDPDSQQALRYDQFISPLTKAVQELSEIVEKQQALIDDLIKRIGGGDAAQSV